VANRETNAGSGLGGARKDRAWLRTTALIGALAGLLGSGGVVALAQDASPAAGDAAFADLGLPEIAVTITEDAYEGVPSELAAGRYVLTVTNTLAPVEEAFGPESSGAGFLQLPADLPAAEFVDLVGPPDDAEGAASPTAGEELMAPPPWYYETGLAGGPYALPGESASAVVDLGPGEWVLWSEYPGAPQAPVPVTVAGEAPADQPIPEAAIRIEMSEFVFTFPSSLTAGSHVVELANVGEQPHFIGLAGVPAGTTVDDALALIGSFENPEATPVADGLTFDVITPALDTADQSAGVTAWYTVDLAPGTYLAVCFVPDAESGTPHAMLGMTQIVEVE